MWFLLHFLLVACAGPSADTGEPPAPATCDAPAVQPPACDSAPVGRGAVVPGPGDPGFDAALDASALARDRQSNGITVWATGVTCEVSVSDAADRALVESFLTDPAAGWDFEAATGRPLTDVVDAWWKAAGAYAGVSIATDAYRYGALRDEGAACAEVEVARERVIGALEALHLAQAITGVEGVIARGFARADLPGGGEVALTALFDDEGNPLPEEKTNGTWRADNSGGLYPDFVWEDSCSRDQYIGWVAGMAAAWEVVRNDSTIPQSLKDRLQTDAEALARSLMVVRDNGYDLEIRDADGRMTYHGILNEQSIDRLYVPDFQNGLNATMSLGIVASLAFVAEEPDIDAWLADALIADRGLPTIVRDMLAPQIDFGTSTNYSNTNMAFIGGWMAVRYLCGDDARGQVREGLQTLYARPGEDRQPIEQSQALYHLVQAVSVGGPTPWAAGGALDDDALARTLDGLSGMRPAPFWDSYVENCDAQEVADARCTLDDRSVVDLWVGEEVVSKSPLSIAIRPPSNYHWRSNPYLPNGGGAGDTLYPNVDWRFVYWSGRYAKR